MKIGFDSKVRTARWLTRGALLFLGPAALIVAMGVVHADVPNSFKDGDTLSAQALNDNFVALDQRLVEVESKPPPINKNGKSISVGGSFCGTTAAPQNGNMGGYAGVKALCENVAACNSPTAHICTGDEVARSAALGLALPDVGRYAAFDPYYGDCSGFTTTSGDGAAWAKPGPAWTTCGFPIPVLCCD